MSPVSLSPRRIGAEAARSAGPAPGEEAGDPRDGHGRPIRASHLSVATGARTLLEDVSLEAGEGERLLLTGPSGSGKSTLARALTGMIPQVIPLRREGVVSVFGVDPAAVPLHVTARRLAMVFQRPQSQLFNLTVRDEVLFGPRNLGLGEDDAENRAAWALDAAGLAGLAWWDARALSYGELQRLCIASVLALGPRAVMLDEPTAHLDAASRKRLVDVLLRLNRTLGITVLVAEHRSDVWLSFCENHLHLAAGRLESGHARPEPGPVGGLLGGVHPRRPGEPVLWLEGVSVARRSSAAAPAAGAGGPLLRDVELEVRAGDLVLLTGDNGAGKTTLARVMAGLDRPLRGRVERRSRPRMLFQDPANQFLTETVDEELGLAVRASGRAGGAGKESVKGFLDELRDMADLWPIRANPVGDLSLGEQRRAALASLVASTWPDPGRAVLILDEPTAGQDDEHLAGLLSLVFDLTGRFGCAAVIITHDDRITRGWPFRRLWVGDGKVREMPAGPGLPSRRA